MTIKYTSLCLILMACNVTLSMEVTPDQELMKYSDMQSMLHQAIKQSDTKKIEQLYKQDSKIINCFLFIEETPLTYAMKLRQWSIFDYLLKLGANPNIPNNRSCPIHIACRFDDPDRANPTKKQIALLKQLLQHDASPHAQQYGNNKTVLHTVVAQYCAQNYFRKQFFKHIINLLLFHGANPHIKDYKDKTPIDLARESQENELADHLEHAREKLIQLLANRLSRIFPKKIAYYIATLRYE